MPRKLRLTEIKWFRALWYTPVIPALGSLRQEKHEFKASLGYIARACLKTKTKE
jgi:hypothetical protein